MAYVAQVTRVGRVLRRVQLLILDTTVATPVLYPLTLPDEEEPKQTISCFALHYLQHSPSSLTSSRGSRGSVMKLSENPAAWLTSAVRMEFDWAPRASHLCFFFLDYSWSATIEHFTKTSKLLVCCVKQTNMMNKKLKQDLLALRTCVGNGPQLLPHQTTTPLVISKPGGKSKL